MGLIKLSEEKDIRNVTELFATSRILESSLIFASSLLNLEIPFTSPVLRELYVIHLHIKYELSSSIQKQQIIPKNWKTVSKLTNWEQLTVP